MLGLCLTLVVAQAANVAASEPETIDVEVALRRAKNEYAYGNYAQAVEQLRALMYPMKLTSDEQVLEARKHLALSHYLLGQTQQAIEEFRKLLFLSPDFQLDPYTIAPAIIELFEDVRKQMKTELDAIRQRKSDEQLDAPSRRGFRRTVEVTISERSELATFMPFGIGQFQNGDTQWGSIFLASEVLLLAVNIGSYVWAASIGDFHSEEPDKRLLIERLTISQYAAATLFGVAWSLGVVQARLNFVPVVRAPPVIHDEPLGRSTAALGGSASLTLSF
jgi:tetratricopeptide (TPR) repeat protein